MFIAFSATFVHIGFYIQNKVVLIQHIKLVPEKQQQHLKMMPNVQQNILLWTLSISHFF